MTRKMLIAVGLAVRLTAQTSQNSLTVGGCSSAGVCAQGQSEIDLSTAAAATSVYVGIGSDPALAVTYLLRLPTSPPAAGVSVLSCGVPTVVNAVPVSSCTWVAVGGGAGIPGPPGPAGATGATGVTGPAGSPGATGATGAQGLVGVQGPTGPSGANGSTGPQGLQGATGPTGPQGIPGPPGPPGNSTVPISPKV
jgi:Collagen triple helix repeat (20 copies)